MSETFLRADIQLIQRILPHRYPFLLVDRVEEIDGTQSALGIKNVTMNEPHFQGHFPGTPIMPGVTIVEAMAQTAAVMVGAAMGMEDKELLGYFMAIDKCKFRRKVGKGELEFVFASDGLHALEVLDENPDVQIVLSDINMPRMDGLSLL